MQVLYNSNSDLLYLRLDDRKQQVTKLTADFLTTSCGISERMTRLWESRFSTLPSASTFATYFLSNTKFQVKPPRPI